MPRFRQQDAPFYKAISNPKFQFPLNQDILQTRHALDIQVSINDLRHWYQHLKFLDGAGVPKSLELLEAGVYLSHQPGLVVWVTGKQIVSDRKSEIRKFAVDSDIILGAHSTGDRLIIFGRERVLPIEILPPLRTEMILTLAATSKSELAQSYERTLYSAGPSHAGWDWAPIYLSPELLDSEYGSLLNIADQMLKGWSLDGNVEYYNFPISSPFRYPFDKPLVLQLKADRLLFNWNTKGFGLVSKSEAGSTYGVTRTGALPVIYRPDNNDGLFQNKETKDAEEHAYSYYSTLNHPILARTVQYTTLFQIFTANEISTDRVPVWPEWRQAEGLKEIALKVLKTLRTVTDEKADNTSKKILEDLEERLQDLEQNEELSLPDSDVLAKELKALSKQYSEFFDEHGVKGENAVADALARTRDSNSRNRDFRKLEAELMAFKLRESPLHLKLCDARKLQKIFSALKPSSENSWIFTPTVVWSRSLGNIATFSGGHNLSSKITRIRSSADVELGKVKIESDGTVVCHSKDAPVIERNARLIESSTSLRNRKFRLNRLLRNSPSETPRVTEKVLNLEGYQRIGRGWTIEHLASSGNSLTPPPKSPPPPPGTQPPSDQPPLGRASNHRPNDVLVLHIGRNKNEKVTIRREIDRDGVTELVGSEKWNRWDLVHAIRTEFEAGGRTIDKKPLRVAFDQTISRTEAERIIKDVHIHGTRVRNDRLLVLYSKNSKTFREPIKTAELNGNVNVSNNINRNNTTGAKVEGAIDAQTAQGKNSVEFEVFLASAKEVPRQKANDSVRSSLKKIEPDVTNLTELIPRVYEGLIRDLNALQRRSSGTFRCAGAGDIHITEFHHRGKVMGLLVSNANGF